MAVLYWNMGFGKTIGLRGIMRSCGKICGTQLTDHRSTRASGNFHNIKFHLCIIIVCRAGPC